MSEAISEPLRSDDVADRLEAKYNELDLLLREVTDLVILAKLHDRAGSSDDPTLTRLRQVLAELPDTVATEVAYVEQDENRQS